MELKDLLAGGATEVKVEVDDGMVVVGYRRTALTPELASIAADPTNEVEGVIDLVTSLVEHWDLTQGGEPYAVTHDNVAKLPLMFLVRLIQAVMKDLTSDPSFGGTSDAGS